MFIRSDPSVFDQEEEGTVLLLTDEADDATLANVREAVNLCLSHALSLLLEAGD